MVIELEAWQLISGAITLLIAFFAGLAGLFKVLYVQLDKRLARMDESRGEDMAKFRQMLAEHVAATEHRLQRVGHLEADIQSYRLLQSDRWEKVGDRVARIEQNLTHTIGHADLSHLHERINGVIKELAQMHGEVTGIRSLVRTIDNYLREQARAGKPETPND